jgi:hypothetical protein
MEPGAHVISTCCGLRRSSGSRRWYSKMSWPGNDFLNQSRGLCGGIEVVVTLALWEDSHLVEIFVGLMVAELALDAAGWLT